MANDANIQLVSITFAVDGRDIGEGEVAAIPIRELFDVPINTPEWRDDHRPDDEWPDRCRACYVVADVQRKALVLMVTVKAEAQKRCTIRATGGGLLGGIEPFAFVGDDSPQTFKVSLSNHSVAENGIQLQDIEWRWEFLSDGDWFPLRLTRHRIYVVLDRPTLPWVLTSSSGETQQPWACVLDFACIWAAGCTSTIEALRRITVMVSQSLGLVYDLDNGASSYVSFSTAFDRQVFEARRFIFELMGGGGGNGRKVNCTDCAAIVVTFSNCVGCDVFTSTMMPEAPGAAFTCNAILAIGCGTWAPIVFSYHEVAWTGQASYGDVLFDACLQVDGGPEPWAGGPHVALQCLDIPFTELPPTPELPLQAPFTLLSYRERLAANSTEGILSCVPWGSSSDGRDGRRPVV